VRILFVSDLHGNRWKYDRLFETARRHNVQAVINGGDMLPKHGDLSDQGKFISYDLVDLSDHAKPANHNQVKTGQR